MCGPNRFLFKINPHFWSKCTRISPIFTLSLFISQALCNFPYLYMVILMLFTFSIILLVWKASSLSTNVLEDLLYVKVWEFKGQHIWLGPYLMTPIYEKVLYFDILTLKAPITTARRRFSWNIMPYWLLLKKRQNMKLSSAANYRWRFKC